MKVVKTTKQIIVADLCLFKLMVFHVVFLLFKLRISGIPDSLNREPSIRYVIYESH